MPDLLIELRSEEIPDAKKSPPACSARRRAICAKAVTDALVDAGLTYEGAREYWTPRRLTLDIRGVTATLADVHEERKGPRTDAPEKASRASCAGGLSSVDEAEVRTDPKKGDFYVAISRKPGRDAEEIIADVMPGIIRLPLAEIDALGQGLARAGLAAMGAAAAVDRLHLRSGDRGAHRHRFRGRRDLVAGNTTSATASTRPITVRRFDDYSEKLERARVVLDAERRKEIIATDARNLAFAQGVELVEDEGLLEEVSGLVEWPVVLMGEFEADFLEDPRRGGAADHQDQPEMLRLPRPEQPAADQPLHPGLQHRGQRRRQGNRRTATARWCARGFPTRCISGRPTRRALPDLAALKPSAEKFGLDLAKPLDQRMAKLDHLGVTFHAKLGTQGERVARIARLAEELAPKVGADRRDATRAAMLAKADLTTEVVGEFPRCRARWAASMPEMQGEDASVAKAVEEHYKPLGPTDEVPTDPVAIAVALADKLDTLTGFWAIDEKPTGSKDPYALRRAALGVIRILLENLGAFLDTEDGRNLLAGTKRAANILAAEEKKGTAIASSVEPSLFELDEEKNLFNAVTQSVSAATQAIENEDYSSAMSALATLREPVDSFFEAVLVNAEVENVRANRLALLAMIRQATGAVADFSKIAG
jgi:glycyl-tRNA synthetase beta chain